MDVEEKYHKLVKAIRSGVSYRDLTRMVGPSPEENEQARFRLEQMDNLSPKCEWDSVAPSSEARRARVRYRAIDARQSEFERKYA